MIAQLGERQTEDLEVLGSIPGAAPFDCFLVVHSSSLHRRITFATFFKRQSAVDAACCSIDIGLVV